MRESTPTSERRRHPRCQAKTGTFVILGDDDRDIGHILDIGQDGLSFSCEHTDPMYCPQEATIIGYYENIGPVSLRNIPLVHVNGTTDAGTSSNRMRMRFGRLTPSQRAKLASFLWLNANAVHQASTPSWV